MSLFTKSLIKEIFKSIVLHGGTHAREWISPITMVNMARRLVEGFRAGGEEAKYLEDITWYITIVVNPDGYWRTYWGDRLWRKTTNIFTPGVCMGVDSNRNWDANWSGPGASGNSCDDTYYGTAVFSEKETRFAADFIRKLVLYL